jgi:hypothetical protein
MIDPEMTVMRLAYAAMDVLDYEAQRRALRYLTERIEADQRSREAAQNGTIEPTAWVPNGGPLKGASYEEKGDAIADADAGDWGIVEVCGIGVTRQEFVVMVPDGDGLEHEIFPTRAAAEQYVARMTEPEPAAPKPEEPE